MGLVVQRREGERIIIGRTIVTVRERHEGHVRLKIETEVPLREGESIALSADSRLLLTRSWEGKARFEIHAPKEVKIWCDPGFGKSHPDQKPELPWPKG